MYVCVRVLLKDKIEKHTSMSFLFFTYKDFFFYLEVFLLCIHMLLQFLQYHLLILSGNYYSFEQCIQI